MVNNLLLLSGNDIPFPEARLVIHQPRIKEIAYVGEEKFFMGCEMLNFSKEILNDKDKVGLENISDFEILMSIMNDKHMLSRQNTEYALMVLMLLFPDYEIKLIKDAIKLEKENQGFFIDKNNFLHFKNIIKSIFCLDKKGGDELEYNPQSAAAKRIADKLKKGREEAAKAKGQGGKSGLEIFSKYSLILAVGEARNINDLMQYTVYQLFKEYEVYSAKEEFEKYFSAQLAGAQNLDKVEHWMSKAYS